MSAEQDSMPMLRREILRSVSRSFYLSIRILPHRLHDPVALAYLLARATDTIADTTELSAEVRAANLQTLADAIQGSSPTVAAAGLRQSFAPLQKNAAERELIEALPACLQWLERMQNSDRADIREVLLKINRGQLLDVQRFGNRTPLYALATAAELEEYTYLVAGCVGEFWTRLGFRHLKNFANRTELEMLKLGREYGKGLQLINILRDAGADLRAGRCYFPADELTAHGVRSEEILGNPAGFTAVMQEWRDLAQARIAAGLNYSCAINNRRVRCATVLPALIGARTLALLRDAGGNALKRKVKMNRGEVRQLTFAIVGTLGSQKSLRRLFARLSL